MHLHEYQAKKLAADLGIDVGPSLLCKSPSDIDELHNKLSLKEAPHFYNSSGEFGCVVKAQVHAGGRGKAGGIKLCSKVDEAVACARELLGMQLYTKQTGKQGKPVSAVLITPLSQIEREFYFAVTVDRANQSVCLMVAAEGGVNIEELAESRPEAIYKVTVPSNRKLRNDHLWNIAHCLKLSTDERKSCFQLIPKLLELFFKTDASLIEVNPLITTPKGELFCLDMRMSLDENALMRHPNLEQLIDETQASPQEVESARHGLSYIALEGDIGCMVNGAGLAMATMDIIDYYGGAPANFLDVGGSASEDRITAGFEVLASAPQVKAIFVNIFGGIMNCATIAKGILASLNQRPISLPIILRMEGTNVEEARELIASSKSIRSFESLSAAAQAAVKAAKTSTH